MKTVIFIKHVLSEYFKILKIFEKRIVVQMRKLIKIIRLIGEQNYAITIIFLSNIKTPDKSVCSAAK